MVDSPDGAAPPSSTSSVSPAAMTLPCWRAFETDGKWNACELGQEGFSRSKYAGAAQAAFPPVLTAGIEA
jgi:hypothetical protein